MFTRCAALLLHDVYPPLFLFFHFKSSEEETRRALENAAKIPEIPKRGEIYVHTNLVILTIICFPFMLCYVVFLIKYHSEVGLIFELHKIVLKALLKRLPLSPNYLEQINRFSKRFWNKCFCH